MCLPVLLAALGGCGDAGNSDEAFDPNPQIAALAREPGLSDYQRSLLEDGRLTRSEYEQAVFRTVDCLEGYGFSDIEAEFDRSGYQIGSTLPGSEITAEDEENRKECFDDSLSAVDLVWVEESRPSPEEEEQSRLRQLECAYSLLEEVGVVVPDGEQEVVRAALELDVDRWSACAFEE